MNSKEVSQKVTGTFKEVQCIIREMTHEAWYWCGLAVTERIGAVGDVIGSNRGVWREGMRR